MIVWSGRGAAVPVITFACLLLTELSTRAYFQDDHYYQAHGWPKLVAFAASAVIVGALSIQREGELSADHPAAVKRSFFRSGDSLFFVPARLWPLILLGLGVLFYFLRD